MADDISTLRDIYKNLYGKQPFMGWDSEELSRRIADAQAGNPDPEPEAPAVELVQVVITCPHTYLPLDAIGNGRLDWATTSDETTKVVKRTRLMVPKDLAAALSAADQAEIL